MKTLRGFTLIEVLVVLMIMSVTVGLATLGFQRLENDRLENTAGKVTGWLQNISDAAVLDGTIYGVSFDPRKRVIKTHFYLNNRWWDVDDEDFISPKLAEDFLLNGENGEPWQEEVVKPEAEFKPQMIFLPVGSAIPERLYLEDKSTHRTVMVERDNDGFFSWQFI